MDPWLWLRCEPQWGVLDDKFLIYLALVLSGAGETWWIDVVDVVVVVSIVGVGVRVLVVDGVWFEWPLLILYMYPLKLLPLLLLLFGWSLDGSVPQYVGLSLLMSQHASLSGFPTLIMKAWKPLNVAWFKALANWFIHVSLFILISSMVLLMDLTILLNNCLSVF